MIICRDLIVGSLGIFPNDNRSSFNANHSVFKLKFISIVNPTINNTIKHTVSVLMNPKTHSKIQLHFFI